MGTNSKEHSANDWFENIHSSIQYYLLGIYVMLPSVLSPGNKMMKKRDVVPTVSEIPLLDMTEKQTKLKVKWQKNYRLL